MREHEIEKKIAYLKTLLSEEKLKDQIVRDIDIMMRYMPGKKISIGDAAKILGIAEYRGKAGAYIGKVLKFAFWAPCRQKVGDRTIRGWVKKQ